MKKNYKVILKTENEKMQEVLTNFTSEELLYEVHKRCNIYIEQWYNAEHINENTGLPINLGIAFIKYAKKNDITEELGVAVEQWIGITKGELKKAIEDSLAPAGWSGIQYRIKFYQLYAVKYDCDIGFYAKLKNEYFSNNQSELRTDMLNYYMPHQGNLRAYLEGIMNEVIIEYFSQY